MAAQRLDQHITVIDFETTGFSAEHHEIIQIGAVKYQTDRKSVV